jgi:hypothetical protein
MVDWDRTSKGGWKETGSGDGKKSDSNPNLQAKILTNPPSHIDKSSMHLKTHLRNVLKARSHISE